MRAPILLLSILLLVFTHSVQAANTTELTFLNWAEYMDPEILEEFKKRTGITVKQIYFDSDGARDELLLETDGKGFDLAIVNGYSIYILAKRGWLEPLVDAEIPNLKHVNPVWRDKHPKAKEYSVPYFWGTLGIAYRKDLVTEDVTSWLDLFQPVKGVQGKIAMIRDEKDIIGPALKALGYSFNSTDKNELNQTEQLLMEQAPHVETYNYVNLDENSSLVSGKISMSIMYSGDALMVQEHNENITYVVPKEGGGIWVDYISVLRESSNKEAAKQFINFINEPEIAAKLAEYVYYATPNMAAEKLLPEEFTSNPVIYPDAATLARSEIYKRVPARVTKKRAAIISRIVK